MKRPLREKGGPPPAARFTSIQTGQADVRIAAKPARVRIIKIAMILLSGLWIYWPAIPGDWLWDDVPLVVGNESLRDLHGLWSIWFSAPTHEYWPMSWTAFWAEWHLWGGHPVAYHIVGLALHIAGALLVWRVLGKLGLRWAWIAALAFTIHPLAVESVAWIFETKNTLSLLFFLLSLSAYIDYDRTRTKTDYILSILYYLVAMLSKTSVVMLPCTLMLYFWWKRGRIAWNDMARLVPYFAIALVLGFSTLYSQFVHAFPDPVVDLRGPGTRLIGAETAIIFYLGKVFFPAGLLPIYPRWELHGLWLPAVLSGAALAGVFGIMWAGRRNWGRHALLGSGFFLINLIPVLGFARMTYMNISWVADHFVYLPMIGLIGLFVLGLQALFRRLAFFYRPFLIMAMFAVYGLLGWESRLCAEHWRNAETLWTYTRDRNPAAWMAHFGLAAAIHKVPGRLTEAIGCYRESLRLMPDFAEAHNNLGSALEEIPGRLDEAISEYGEALRLRPDFAEAHNNLGGALEAVPGRLDEAISEYGEALRLQPAFVEAHFNLARVLERKPGRLDDAIAEYQKALRLRPGLAQAHFSLGHALERMQGGWNQAIAQYEEALRLKPDYAEASNNLGIMLCQTGRIQEGMARIEAAIRMQPDFGWAHLARATALLQSGRRDEAAAELNEVLRLWPNDPMARKMQELIQSAH